MSESSFEWNEAKDLDNQRKHGVSFYEAHQKMIRQLLDEYVARQKGASK